MSTAITRAPAFAIASAMPSPMPEPAPVTSATRPVSNPSMIDSLRAIKRDREFRDPRARRFNRDGLVGALRLDAQQGRERLAGGADIELVALGFAAILPAAPPISFEPIPRHRAAALNDAAREFDLVTVGRAAQIELQAVAGLFRDVFGKAAHALVRSVRGVGDAAARPRT